MGVEPATYALRVRCSTTELHRLIYKQAEKSARQWDGCPKAPHRDKLVAILRGYVKARLAADGNQPHRVILI